jgi:WD40 repeat protein
VGYLKPVACVLFFATLFALLAAAASALIAVGVVLAAGGPPTADPPKVDPPKPANPTTAPQPRVDLFGDRLPDGVLMRLGTTRSRAGISSFGILPDGTVVTTSTTAEVLVWPPKGDRPGAPVRLTTPGPRTRDPLAVVSPDGRYVAANTPDKLVTVWERKDDGFKEVVSFDIGRISLLFSPDGTRLLVGGRLGDIRTGKSQVLDGLPGNEAMAFSGDGKRLAATNGYQASLWDLESGKQLAGYKTGRVRYSGIALDHAGEVMAVSPTWEPDTVVFVDPMTGARVAKLTGPENFRCLWANFAPDGKTVLLGDRGGVTWWDPVAGKSIRRFEGVAHSWSGGRNVPARFTPDGKVLVGTSGRMLLRWDAATGRPLRPDVHDAGHFADVTAVVVSADGKWIATGGRDARVRVWDAATGRPAVAFPADWIVGARTLGFSPDGRFAYGPSPDGGGVTKWEAATGGEVVRFKYSPDASKRHGLIALRVSPDGRTVAALSGPFSAADPILLGRWDTESGKSLSEKSVTLDAFRGGTFSPDGRWISTSTSLYPVEVGPAGNTLQMEGYSVIDPGTFSADGRLVVKELMPRGDERAWRAGVFEVVTGAKVAELPLGSSSRFAFHPDGRSLASASSKGLTFYDLTTGRPFAERKAPEPDWDTPSQSFAKVVQYVPDGTKLVTGHADTTALIWEVPARPKAAKALTEKERATAWDDLASADGARGWAAVWALADDPGSAAFLRDRVRPVEPLPAKEFEKLLADLDAEEFADRTAAAKQLAAAGERAIGQLRDSLKAGVSAEQRDAAGRLLKAWAAADQKPPTGERLRVVRAVAALELAGTADARKLLAELAKGAADATATREAKGALERAGR